MFDNYLEFLDACESYAEREFSAWVDADADFEEPLDEYTEGG
jgi:hypothetical protein